MFLNVYDDYLKGRNIYAKKFLRKKFSRIGGPKNVTFPEEIFANRVKNVYFAEVIFLNSKDK